MEKPDEAKSPAVDQDGLETWVTPEIASYSPVKAAEGISYLPGDGVSNLTP